MDTKLVTSDQAAIWEAGKRWYINDWSIHSRYTYMSVWIQEECLGRTVLDEDIITPLKEGDVATTGNLENKVATNAQSYETCEKQLFAIRCVTCYY